MGVQIRPTSKATSTNPKDLFGSSKVSITKVPHIAVLHCAHAMMNGVSKYGAYNWRDKEVLATIYVDAAIRHLGDWLEGEEDAPDSRVHHLGHVMACCAIILDAQAGGNLIDDRPLIAENSHYREAIAALKEKISANVAAWEAAKLKPERRQRQRRGDSRTRAG